MGSGSSEIAIDAFPFLRLYKNGTVERLAGTGVAPAGLDSETGVLSKDVVLDAGTGVSARLYHPCAAGKQERLPLAVYFHGGGFFISSTADPVYHCFLNSLAAKSNSIVASIDYRLAPETPLPAAFDDCWSALRWIGCGATNESWIDDDADLNRVVLVGDSAGANIAHNMICRFSDSGDSKPAIRIAAAAMVHPYFWGEALLASESRDLVRRAMVDRWWAVACPSEKGNDDPLINPFVVGAPSLAGLRSCERIVVVLAGNDILRERGWLYYDTVLKSGLWKGEIEMVETQGEDHIFHILTPHTDKARKLLDRLADFVSSS